MPQIPLRLNQQDMFGLTNFYFSQTELEQIISRFAGLDDIAFLYLWGQASTGKSHLLLALTEHVQKAAKRALYLPLSELTESASADVLDSVEELDLLCIDDLDAIAGNTKWQDALFHCFNRLQHTGCKLLISSNSNPTMSAITLDDLRSRLATGLIYQILPLNDEEKQKMLMLQSASRGLKMPKEVAEYLLRHHSRDTAELMTLLKQLDRASMVEKRRLTVPFVRQALADG